MEDVTFRYEIEDGTNAVRIWSSTQEPPIIFQPTWPNGAEWTTEQATAWAEQYISAATDTTAALAGNSPEEPTMDRIPEDQVPVISMTQVELDSYIAARVAEAVAAPAE